MATASSVQREPSMEEILASIRRIIEDSDTGRKPSGDAGDLLQDLEPAQADESAPDLDIFRAELRGDPGVRKPIALAEVPVQQATAEPSSTHMETPARLYPDWPSASAATAPTTLAEVSARVAAEQATVARVDAPATVRMPETTDTIVADWRREIAAIGEPTKVTTAISGKVEIPRETESAAAIVEDELVAEASEPAPVQVGSIRQAASETPPARPAIVSEHTGRQVAAAFGELSDAFASRSKKTFDEMAEEMLRPMLQDWLDNNLPTLVERLVREEIERVARGAQ
jgi:cell pole-organizing protein PopZ